MPTLFDQPPRLEENYGISRLTGYFSAVRDALDFMKVGGEPTLEQWNTACRIVETALKIQSADVLDEQLAGFGELLQTLTSVLKYSS